MWLNTALSEGCDIPSLNFGIFARAERNRLKLFNDLDDYFGYTQVSQR
jgi:hypothetical protein